jgi:heme/copper-type cytochrome/quinol oxidase subunit 2
MVAFVKVVSPSAYQAWLSSQESMITTANNQVTPLRQYLQSTGNL